MDVDDTRSWSESVAQEVKDAILGSLFPFTIEFWTKYWCVVLGSSLYLLASFVIVSHLASPHDKKRSAYLFSMFAAIFTSSTAAPVTVYWLAEWIRHRGDIEYLAALFLSANWYSDIIEIFFLVFLWTDCLFSLIIFHGHMEILAGWIHHLAYMCLVSNSLKWRFSFGLTVMFIEEIPTFILAMGSVYPMFRTEMGFGVTFFLLRIVFHFVCVLWSMHPAIASRSGLWVLGILTSFMHVVWFTGWVRRQMRLAAQERDTGLVGMAEKRHPLQKFDPLLMDACAPMAAAVTSPSNLFEEDAQTPSSGSDTAHGHGVGDSVGGGDNTVVEGQALIKRDSQRRSAGLAD